MKERALKHKTLIIIAAAAVLAAIGFTAGMAAKTSLAKGSGDYIGAEQAKIIALENVGVSASKATFTKVEVDTSDNPAVYEIEFYTTVNEYDFEIQAFTGDILEKSSEPIKDATVSSQNQNSSQITDVTQQVSKGTKASSSEYIGISKAKEIALSHAGVSSATFTKAKLDSDDGVKIYELEFTSGNYEYEYEIQAFTGKILEHDAEKHSGHDDGHDDD